jgi:hypothetical protein
MGRPRKEPTQHELIIAVHPVMLALSKARAAMTLADICAHGSDYLQMPKTAITSTDERDIRDWIQGFAFDALGEALDEAAQAFRGAVTTEQVHEQVIGPKAAIVASELAAEDEVQKLERMLRKQEGA